MYKKLKEFETRFPLYFAIPTDFKQVGSWHEFGLSVEMGKNPECSRAAHKSAYREINTFLDQAIEFSSFYYEEDDSVETFAKLAICVRDTMPHFEELKAYFYLQSESQNKGIREVGPSTFLLSDEIV